MKMAARLRRPIGSQIHEVVGRQNVAGKASFRRKTKSGAETARLGRALSALKNPRKNKKRPEGSSGRTFLQEEYTTPVNFFRP